jgi:hypothetical protein
MGMRQLLVDSPNSVGARLRSRRWSMICETFGSLSDSVVLDLGGTADFWLRVPQPPRHVTVVNLEKQDGEADWLEPVAGNACTYQPDRAFDIVFSNSLLEHVGGHANRRELATVIRTAAPRYYVQTPYRYFPVEPHWLFPGMQFLPVPARASIARSWPLAHTRSRDRQDAVNSVLWIELVGKSEMAELFPDARIMFERVAGLPKSLLAVRV